MSFKDKDIDYMETSLDAVEIDKDGNIRRTCSASDPGQLDEMETDLDAVEVNAVDVDEDGNLRIHSAEKLLNTSSSGKDSPSDSENVDGLSAEERRSLERTRFLKQQYSRQGTHEEAKGMDYVNNQNGTRPRRRSFSAERDADDFHRLAVGSDDVGDGTGSAAHHAQGASIQGHDLHDIELSVFRQGRAEENHPSGSGPSLESVERGETQKPRPDSISGWVLRFLEIIRDFFKNMSPKRLAIFVALGVVVIGIGLTFGLVPASFVYIEYHELALAKNRVTGKVNRDNVYYPGCYLLTPETELLRFKGTAHIVKQKLELYTSDQLTVELGLSLQYFIKPEELGALFTNYERKYEDVVDAVIRSTVKNEAGKYSLDNFRLNRSVVEQDFRRSIAFRLAGNCCPSCCPNCQANVECRSCKLAGRCYPGFHMEMRYFQMGVIDAPSEVTERLLQQTLLLVYAERENFLQEHSVETKISQKLQKEVLNRAAEIKEAANAEADKIRAVAEADFEKKVQASYAEALKKMYQRLNITQEDHKLSFMYIRALEDMSDNLYNINFDTLTRFDSGEH
ncbi:uncharacterized protein [Littorina saxatilis]|uniref:uncharacterized protein isoform X3 n=1 Tax=Littorina saxatilis TaxID=31220 RepID=UPI0038B5FE0C